MNVSDISALQKALLSANLLKVEAILKDKLPTNEGPIDRIDKFTYRCRRRQVVKFLLEYHKNLTISPTNYSSLLHFAVVNQDNDIFNLILESKDLNININAVHPETKMTLLHHIAMRKGTHQMAKALLEHGAQVNAVGISDLTPLHLVCNNRAYQYHLNYGCIIFKPYDKYLQEASLVQLLLDHGSDPEIEAGHAKETALHLACTSGNVKVVELLLQYGANVNVDDRFGKTVLHKAMYICQPSLIKLLLEKGFDPNRKDYKGRTPLIQHDFDQNISRLNCKAALDLLIKYGADVNITDYNENTLMHIACGQSSECTFYLKYFLKRNININALNKCRETPLDVALQTEGLYGGTCIENVKILCAYIAKLKATDSFICEENLHLIKNHPTIKEFYNEFELEVYNMKKEKISSSSHVSYLDILNASSHKLTAFARNSEIMKSLKSEKYKEMFPLYASILMDALKEVEIRRDLIETCAFRLCKHVKRNLSHLIVDNIFRYLSDEDLENFEEAFLNK